MTKLTDKDKLKLVWIVLFTMCLLSLVYDSKAQHISNTELGYSVIISDLEKTVKASAASIPSKDNLIWFTNTDKLLQWNSIYNKGNNTYYLKLNGVELYNSTTIAGIRNRYIAYMLGIEFNNNNI